MHNELLPSAESESHSVMFDLLRPMDYKVRGILQAIILVRVAFPFSRASSQPRDQTHVSRIAGGFFTSWATGNTGVGSLFLLRWNLLDPGIKPESPALQTDSLPTELSGKPSKCWQGIKLTNVAKVLMSIFSNSQGLSSTSLPPSHIPHLEIMLLLAWQLFWLGKTGEDC